MRKKFGKSLSSFLICAVGVAVVLIGTVYFNFISKRIYEDSTDHLEEIYDQVNRTFGSFVERNWGLLESWGSYLEAAGDSASEHDFLAREKEYWGFSDFYFISYGKTCMTIDKTLGDIETGEAWDKLTGGEPVMAGETLPDGREVTVFAAPVERGEYEGFAYDAIALSYTNEDMVKSLNADAFAGKAKCFVIHDDGSILLSTQTGGNVFDNYLAYLKGASNLDEGELQGIQNDWQNGERGLLQCKIGGVKYCILYQPVGYQDYVLLSSVPQSVVSAGFLSVQKITINALIVIFLLIGAAAVAVIIIRGRSKSRKTRAELAYRERMFDVLSNSVDDIFIMLNSSLSGADYISPNVERLIGVTADAVKKDIRALERCAVVEGARASAKELREIPFNGCISRDYVYTHQSTGERRWYRVTLYRMNISDDEKIIVVMSDRTVERQMNKQMEDALTAARSANEAKSNFLSNMSHDIRTPMNAIVGFAALLEKDADNADKAREYAQKITASSHHLLSLINDVLDMSKIESGKTSLNVDRFTLSEIIDEINIILAPQAKAKNQEFVINVKGDPPESLLGDRLRLNQILLNLLSNSIKYTPEGGRVEFTVSEASKSTPQYATLRFVVKDNGIGMSEEFQKNIFAPFSREVNSVTNKIQGTGLGMAITKNLVDLMGGIIRVESRPNEGSTFTVEMPLALPPKNAKASDEAVGDGARADAKADIMKGKLFLVAEDNELNAEILTEMLSAEGVRCETAVNGKEAVDMFTRSAKGYYDMILMDVQMPVMNGYEATRAIRQSSHPEAATIPIAAMTANTFAEDVRDALEAGMNAHLAKPIDMNAVREEAVRLLSDKNSGKGGVGNE